MTDGRLRLGVFMVALAQAACGDDLAQAAYGDDYEGQVRDWAGDVLLGIEFGQSAQISRRWTESPTLSLFSGNAEHSALVDEVVADVDSVLQRASLSVQRGPDRDSSADIKVYFVDFDDFAEIAEREEIAVVPGNVGQFYVRWNDNQSLISAVVLIARDRLAGSQLRHFAYEELTQVLGTLNDSPIFEDSVFYSSSRGDGAAQRLSAEDRWLLEFLYTELRPGASEDDLEDALDRRLPADLEECGILGC